jgi:hypothetical protein
MTTGITRLFLTKIKHNSEEQMTRTEKGMKLIKSPDEIFWLSKKFARSQS